jgi:hypothetical protein
MDKLENDVKQKWVVYITYGVLVDSDTILSPEENDSDYHKLRALAVEKMWGNGIEEVKTEAEVEFEDVSEEFDILVAS